MSVDWATIRPRIIDVFTGIAFDQVMEPASPPGQPVPFFDTALPKAQAVWAERSTNAFTSTSQKQQLTLKVMSVVAHGDDEWRYDLEDVPGTDPVTTDWYQTIVGLRRIVLQVRVDDQEETDGQWAFQTIERIRSRLGWQRIIDSLLEVNVDITDILDARDATYTADDRRVSCAIMTVVLTAAINDTDPIPIGYIAHVVMSTNVSSEGVALPSPPNIVDETIPDT